jgi:hypothetical protein
MSPDRQELAGKRQEKAWILRATYCATKSVGGCPKVSTPALPISPLTRLALLCFASNWSVRFRHSLDLFQRKAHRVYPSNSGNPPSSSFPPPSFALLRPRPLLSRMPSGLLSRVTTSLINKHLSAPTPRATPPSTEHQTEQSPTPSPIINVVLPENPSTVHLKATSTKQEPMYTG